MLTVNEPAGAQAAPARAFLRVGGVALVRYQLGLALALGCEKVLCVANQVDGEVMALQHAAEEAGAQFQVASGPHGLLGLVSAADEVVALGEGLLAWPELAVNLLGAGPVVLAQPVESGLAAGFERLDINHAAGAAMRFPGRLIERLAELPADCDTFAGLQRIALQSGVPMRLLPGEAHESGRWSLVRNEADAHAIEAAWIRLHTALPGRATPALLVARKAVRALGPALLHAGSSGLVVAMAAVTLALLGLVASWFGFVVAGLAFCAVAWVLFLAAALFGRIERGVLQREAPRLPVVGMYAAGLDVVLALVLSWNGPAGVREGLIHHGFAPLVLLGVTRLIARVVPSPWAPLLEDRAVLALVLALAALAGVLGPVIGLLALGCLAVGLWSTSQQNRLTRL